MERSKSYGLSSLNYGAMQPSSGENSLRSLSSLSFMKGVMSAAYVPPKGGSAVYEIILWGFGVNLT